MLIHITAEDIERANRLSQDPYDSENVVYTIYEQPVASDDGLFKHRSEWVPCHGCQPDPVTGEGIWMHGHIVVEGSNGGVRCEPLTDESFRRHAREILYPTPNGASIHVMRDGEKGCGIALSCSTGRGAVQHMPLPVSEAASAALASDGADALDRLVALGLLFEDGEGES